MTKRMSKTLAVEIATRTIDVISPANRGLALSSALRRHGFESASATTNAPLLDRSELVAWLLATYGSAGQ